MIIFLLVAAILIGGIRAVTINQSNRTKIQLQAEIASWETSDFFQPYIAMAENLAVNSQIQELLAENKNGGDITKHEQYDNSFRRSSLHRNPPLPVRAKIKQISHTFFRIDMPL